MNSTYTWSQMLDDFRQLGGSAENIEQRAGQYGNGIFPIDPAKPIAIAVPAALLVDADILVLDGENLVVDPASGVPADVRNFIDRYQKHFSWGADGRKQVEAFENALKTLPGPLLERLQQIHLLNMSFRHKEPWLGVLRQRFLQSRRINYHERKVSMPIIELINHSPRSQGYLINDGIQFKGLFPGEVTVNYSPNSDSLLRFLTYGFANLEPAAYSLPMHLKMSDGITVHVGSEREVICIVDKLPLPKVVQDGKQYRLSHLLLGRERAPRLPRSVFRKTLSDLPAAMADEIFDRLRNANLLELCNLLELADGDDNSITKEFRNAVLYQLKAMTHCYGIRMDVDKNLSTT